MRYKQDMIYLVEIMMDLEYHKRKQYEWNLKDQTHYVALYNTILMDICSYLDEYNDNFFQKAEEQFKGRILEIRKISKPAFKKIKEWKDLKEYRNQMIAHNFRINGNDFSFNMLGQYNAPRTWADLVLLRKNIFMINSVIEAEFNEEMKQINSFIRSFQVKEKKFNYDNIENDITDVVGEINQLCIANSKTYRLNIDYFMKV